MPRLARIDFPDAYHHVIARGVDRRPIFFDDQDRAYFCARFEKALRETRAKCFAWALIPNHFHFLIQTGEKPLSALMQSLMTSYAMYFNKRWRRSGHLFQNRFHSTLCEKDPYFLACVRYIHLNPLRARLVRDLEELDRFTWSGHATLMGNRSVSWQDCRGVLDYFPSGTKESLPQYREFLESDLQRELKRKTPMDDLQEWVRHRDGTWIPAMQRDFVSSCRGEERILGSEEFIREILAKSGETLALPTQRTQIDDILCRASAQFQLPLEKLRGGGKSEVQNLARAAICRELHFKLKLEQSAIAKELGISISSIKRGLARNRAVSLQKEDQS